MQQDEPTKGPDLSHLERIDHVELFLGNARQAAHFFRTAFGFRTTAYAGPETGVHDRVSFAVEQGDVRLVLTSPTSSRGVIAEHIARHGDGVRDVAFTVADARAAFERAMAGGARSIGGPEERFDERGRVVTATVATFGDTVHTFVERCDYEGTFLPGYEPVEQPVEAVATGLERLDHLAICIERGTIAQWVAFYQDALGLTRSQEETISSDYSGMETQVVRSASSGVILVLVEPKEGPRSSPIQAYLDAYDGPGVHHIALGSSNIVATVGALRANGVEFPRTPESYYEALEERMGALEHTVDELRAYDVLADRDASGHLFQIFTKPIQARPTYFFEVIERRNAQGFGNGNIKALYESIEREQAARGGA